ncbi:MAG TPA: HAD-IB family hydrolase [Solirubrobacteraceae bacterium]|jgi:putative phosphoserine phosphatase/1-acylglycerol-3-phosphate O-acyltransferase|nr:HAD-IB family hydrolase [Solirubrobacteraceae bacterium]
MTATVSELLAEIERAPQGPQVGAFFDFDGTLIAGYSAQVFYEDRIRRFEMGPGEIARSLIAGAGMALNGADVSKLMEVAVANWAGHREDEVRELWDGLFYKRISGMVYPEARELVKAHLRAGHTVAVASSATRYQLAALAEDLGVTNVLCSEVELVKGFFSGYVVGPVLWGPAKARAVQEFADEHRVDLQRSFAYANGDEDVPFLEAVGNPRALNPGSGMRKAAREHNWPAVELAGRGRTGIADIVRTGVALAGLGAAGGVGIAYGLLTGDRRTGANLAASIGPDLALALAGVHLNVTGEEHLWSDRPAVFIFNHQSSIDVAVIGSLVRRDLTGVAKIEARRDPRFAPIGYVTDIVYVDRSNSKQARAALQPAVDRLKSGTSIAIAPEGTRSPTPTLGRFKKGAFHLAMQAGVPLVPVVIRNAGDVMWRGSLVIRPGTIDVAVQPPISTEAWEVEQLDERIAEVHGLFERTLEEWTLTKL